jgi:hypothetical protein
MSQFEFLFSLFGLLLGLSLAEIFGGFARTVQARRKIRLGWLTPLLGLLVVVDLLSFWGRAWAERDALAVSFSLMVFITLLAGIYYVAASLVFPHDHDEWPDLDDYFMQHKGIVTGCVMGVNVLVIAGEAVQHGNPYRDPAFVIINLLFVATAAGIILARRKWLSGGLLVVMLSLYWVPGVILGWLGR